MKLLLIILVWLFLVPNIAYANEILYTSGQKDRKEGAISWYATGRRGLFTACWNVYKGERFRVTYLGKSIVVTCWDIGHFRELGRVLDLDIYAFEQLAPKSKGIIRGAKVEVIN